jgi:hypothetical protein
MRFTETNGITSMNVVFFGKIKKECNCFMYELFVHKIKAIYLAYLLCICLFDYRNFKLMSGILTLKVYENKCLANSVFFHTCVVQYNHVKVKFNLKLFCEQSHQTNMHNCYMKLNIDHLQIHNFLFWTFLYMANI